MAIVAVVIALAAIVWGSLYVWRGSLLVGCGLVLATGYALGHEFWNVNLGPLPLTLERIMLAGLVGVLVLQWRLGRLTIGPLAAGDLVLALLVAIVTASALASGNADFGIGIGSKWGRLLTSYFIPATIFLVARQVKVSKPDWARLLGALVLLGVYLAATGMLEVAGRWELVFPRYISNPLLGTHFGRARGPELNAVSLGLYLTATFWCAWTLMQHLPRRWQQLALLATLPLIAGGIVVTYTRSTWIGLAVSGLVVAAMEVPRRWRLPAIGSAVIGGIVLLAASWTHLTGLEREGSAADSSHSVDQRTSFAYVSWQMFCDHPLLGVGYGRFYDRKLPYLSDRSQQFELDSIRALHHHNTLLSVLTETGLVGLSAFLAVAAVWTRAAWSLFQQRHASPWLGSQGVLMLALLANYACSALFHDLTLIPSQHLLLFAFAGLTVNLRQQTAGELVAAWSGHAPMRPNCFRRAVAVGRAAAARLFATSDGVTASASPATYLFGMRIARITMGEAVQCVLAQCRQPRARRCHYVVTPNVDHAVQFQHRADLRAAYADASLVVADGAPIVLVSRLLGRPLPERVAGSDLVPRLFESAGSKLTVFLLGAAPGVAEAAAARITRQFPNVQVVGTYSPPIGFERNPLENARALAAVAAAAPDLLVVGLGAPKQEVWVHEHRRELQAKVALCAGATIDFLAGHRSRSPRWMRRVGLEWLYRLATEPRRLAARYARDAWVLPQLVWHEWRPGRSFARGAVSAKSPQTR